MELYFLYSLTTFLFSAFVMGFYYIGYSFHIETPLSSMYVYFAIVLTFYALYKFFTIFLEKKELSFSIFHIFTLFLLQLFFLSGVYFTIVDQSFGNALILFFRVLWFLFLPLFFTLYFYSTGETIIKALKIPNLEYISRIFLSFGIGFFIFITFLTIAAFFAYYSLNVVLGIIILGLVLSYKEHFKNIRGIFTPIFTLENHDIYSDSWIKRFAPYLLTTEFLFIVATFLLSVNFINVLRPYPIGWDDLGVYMNFPRLMAEAGSYLPLGQMMTWQIFTGIGFLFQSTTQAFFLNSFSGVWAFLGVGLFLYHFGLKSKIVNIPLLFATLYLAMPMVIFHLAKDMKLDQALFAFTIISIFLVFDFLTHHSQKEKIHKNDIIFLAIAGLIIGMCFTIKITSLLLISGTLGAIFFRYLGISGFFGYIMFYFAIFTYGKLWSFLSVVYPKDNQTFIVLTTIVFFIFGVFSFAFSFGHRKNLGNFLKTFLSIIIGILLAVSPWLVNNYFSFSAGEPIGILGLLNGKNEVFLPDYTKIHTQDFLEKVKFDTAMKSTGTSSNEDLGRYFGYEKGLNNYVKLPWNLTMQVNQKGEFTDISFIFLALLPTLFLFYPFRRKYYSLPIFLGIFFVILLNALTPSVNFFTQIFEKIFLPEGYLYIFLIFLVGFLYLFYSFKWEDKKLQLFFNISLSFGIFYIFLWTIGAFGIVWYGIGMYLIFFIFMGFGMYFASQGMEVTNKEEKTFTASIVLGITLIYFTYFIVSSFPHGIENLKASGNFTYKMGTESESRALFVAHPEYLKILFELNIDDLKKDQMLEKFKNHFLEAFKNDKNVSSISKMVGEVKSLEEFSSLLNEIYSSDQVPDVSIKNRALATLEYIYNMVLSPKKDIQSNEKIYRVGTFMKYYISSNNSRVFEDSLLFSLRRYFYAGVEETNVEKVIERMKQVGMKYVLIDLNAATIDEDPELALTKRYESLLNILTSNTVDIVSSDSPCFLIGVEQYRKSTRTKEDYDRFLALTTVNSQGLVDGKMMSKVNKMMYCYNTISHLKQYNQINESNYSFLLNFSKLLDAQEFSSDEQRVSFYSKYIGTGYKALLKLN